MTTYIRDALSHIVNADSIYKIQLKKAAVVTSLAVPAICSPWQETRIIGATVLSGIGYGIANEMIRSYNCPKHFDNKHIYARCPIQKLPFSINAIISGTLDYWRISVIAGTIFAVIARVPCTSFFNMKKLTLSQITPNMTIGITAITLVIQASTYFIQKRYKTDPIITCSIQHAVSYGLFATSNIIFGTTLAAVRVGLIKF